MKEVLIMWLYMMSLSFIVIGALFAPQIAQKPEQFEINIIIAALLNVSAFIYVIAYKSKKQ